MTDDNANRPEQILDSAQAILDGKTMMPKTRAPRASAMLARQALEDAVRDLCDLAGADVGRATMRSRLIIIRVLLGSGVADLAETAWAGLTRACHHHAYELAPNADEVDHLIGLVSKLNQHRN